MKIYNNIDDFKPVKNAVVTIGTFDGVHLGHRKIIERIKQLAKKSGGETVILTFFPHPRMILHPEDQGLKMINTMDEKAQLLEQLGVPVPSVPLLIAAGTLTVTHRIHTVPAMASSIPATYSS